MPWRGALERGSLVAVIAVLALTLVGAAEAALVVGVNDSAPLDPSELAWFYPTMAAEGLQLDTLTLRWDDTQPTLIPNQAQVSAAITEAQANGVQIELDLYPLHSMVFTGDAACTPSSDPQACGNTAEIQAFAAWTAAVAQAFPSVHEFVVMNECNQPLFINPQWNSAGQNQSAEICGRALAASYDALKALDPANVVWGVGLSPRGNDNPAAASDSSTSPVAFLQDLGAWFKSFVAATGRTAPLMDGLDFHPYPIPQSQPFSQGYQDTSDASVANLPRIYQAFYNGFSGSPQPTIGQQAGGGLPVSLNEVGIQTAETGVAGYTGTEVSADADGGVIGQYATPAYQAAWYVQMLNLVACDPNVRVVNVYHLIDESDLAGWQSGLYDVNRNPKQSAAAVHDWIATDDGACSGTPQPWTPSGVAAAPSSTSPPAKESAQRIVAAAGGRVRVFDAASDRLRRILAPFGSAYTGPLSLAVGVSHGVEEIAVGEGSGGRPTVELLNARTDRVLGSVTPFPTSFHGGVSVAFGDLAGSGSDDLIVGSGPGMAAQVVVYPGGGGAPLERLTSFGASLRAGVTVAAGPLGGPGADDLIVGSGAGVRSQVEVFRGSATLPVETLSPFPASFSGGVSVAAADLTGSGTADLVVGSGTGRTSVVKAYRGLTSGRLWSVDAFGPAFAGGVSVATVAVGGQKGAEVVLGAGAGGGSQVKVLDGASGAFVASFLAAPGSNQTAVAAG